MSITRYNAPDWNQHTFTTADRMNRHPEGDYVTYTDHVAEVERVRLIEGMACEDHSRDRAEAMRAACISAVEAQPFWIESTDQSDFEVLDKDGLLAALREVQP